MIELFNKQEVSAAMPSVWCPLANWKTHLEEPYESRGSRTVPRGAGGEIPLAYSTGELN